MKLQITSFSKSNLDSCAFCILPLVYEEAAILWSLPSMQHPSVCSTHAVYTFWTEWRRNYLDATVPSAALVYFHLLNHSIERANARPEMSTCCFENDLWTINTSKRNPCISELWPQKPPRTYTNRNRNQLTVQHQSMLLLICPGRGQGFRAPQHQVLNFPKDTQR